MMRKPALSLALFIIVSSIYFATATGITTSNEGSSYALVRAIADEGRFSIDSYFEYTGNNDYAVRDGVYYSDRPPGTALVTIPFYVVGDVLPARPIASTYDSDNPRLITTMLSPALFGAATVILLYQLLLWLNITEWSALLTSIAFAFGSTNWRYGSVLFTHGISAFFVLATVALALWVIRTQLRRLGNGGIHFVGSDRRIRLPNEMQKSHIFLLGFLAGTSVLVEYSNALFFVLVAVYVGIALLSTIRHNIQTVIIGGIGAAIPIGFLMFYNTVNFGGPFTTSYTFAENYPWAASFSTTFTYSPLKGIPALLWSGSDASGAQGQVDGMFRLMPITLVGLVGIYPYIRRYSREALFTFSVFGTFLLLFSTHLTFSAGTGDGRYLMPFLSLWFIAVGFGIDTLLKHRLKNIAMIVVAGLLCLSVYNIATHIGTFYGYNDYIFPNATNLHVLWFVLLAIVATRTAKSQPLRDATVILLITLLAYIPTIGHFELSHTEALRLDNLKIWTSFVGDSEFALRYGGVLVILLGASIAYRVVARMRVRYAVPIVMGVVLIIWNVFPVPRTDTTWRETMQKIVPYAQAGDRVLPNDDPVIQHYAKKLLPQMDDTSTHVWVVDEGSGASLLDAYIQTFVIDGISRYDIVPDDELAVYENGAILRAIRVEQDTMQVDLWWDYQEGDIFTVSVIVFDENGMVVAQHDAPPLSAIYDSHQLDISPLDSYTIGIKLYVWSPDEITIIPTQDGQEYAIVDVPIGDGR